MDYVWRCEGALARYFPIEESFVRKRYKDEKKGEKKNDVKNVDYTNYEEGIYVGYRYFDSFDREVLVQALESHAFYIGMIGSRSKKDGVYAALRKEGVPDAELACVRCPIGLPVGADSPQQIAVSVVAELLAARAGTLQRLRIDD